MENIKQAILLSNLNDQTKASVINNLIRVIKKAKAEKKMNVHISARNLTEAFNWSLTEDGDDYWRTVDGIIKKYY